MHGFYSCYHSLSVTTFAAMWLASDASSHRICKSVERTKQQSKTRMSWCGFDTLSRWSRPCDKDAKLVSNTCHNLRQRTHNLTLPSDVSSIAKQNCIPRMLFADWCVLFPKCIYVLLCVLYFSCRFCFICKTCAFVICALKNYLLTYLVNV